MIYLNVVPTTLYVPSLKCREGREPAVPRLQVFGRVGEGRGKGVRKSAEEERGGRGGQG